MKKPMLTLMILFFNIAFWPLGLYLHNQSSELSTFFIPTLLLFLVYKVRKNSLLVLILLIALAVVVPKLALFPFVYVVFDTLQKDTKSKRAIITIRTVLLTLSTLLTLFALFTPFKGQSVFVPDYEAQQKVIRDQQLYPHPYLARAFHNKARVALDKVNDNFFAMIDPNNYFFGFAPRQIVENQNIQKFPFLSLPLFLLGLYYLKESKNKTFIVTSSMAALVTLSLVNNFDKNDFILFLPLFLILVHGVEIFENKYPQYKNAYYLFFILFSTIELIRIFI